MQFPSEYDRCNPVTRAKAIEDWMNLFDNDDQRRNIEEQKYESFNFKLINIGQLQLNSMYKAFYRVHN